MTNEICSCGLVLQEGERHPALIDCVHALQAAMIRQKEAAASLSFDLSVRYLSIIEQLAKAAGDGTVIGGVYANIKKRYEEMGDWSPMQHLRERNEDLAVLAKKSIALLSKAFTEQYATVCDRADLSDLTAIGEDAKRLGVLPPGPFDYESRRR